MHLLSASFKNDQMFHSNTTKAVYVCCPSSTLFFIQGSPLGISCLHLLPLSSASVSLTNFMLSSGHPLYLLSVPRTSPNHLSLIIQHTAVMVSAPSQLSFLLSHASPLTLCFTCSNLLADTSFFTPLNLKCLYHLDLSFTLVFCVA